MEYEAATKIVQRKSTGEEISSEVLLAAGTVLYRKRKGSHVCYQNDNFYVAAMCGLEERKLRFAAAQALNNALTGYWEWQTHAGWNMQVLLHYLGISSSQIPPLTSNKFCDYSTLSVELCLDLSDKYTLPWSDAPRRATYHPQDAQLKADLHDWWSDVYLRENKFFTAFPFRETV